MLDFRNLHHAAPPRFHHLMGLGDVCVSGPYGSDANGPLCLDQNTGSPVSCNDPRCAAGGASSSPASNTPQFDAAGNPIFATWQGIGPLPTTSYTLASYMATWVQQMTAQSTASLVNQGISGPQDFLSVAMGEAQAYCADENPPDCGQLASIAAAAAAQVAAAYKNVPASQWNPSSFTAYAAPTPPPAHIITSPGPSVPAAVITPPSTPVLATPVSAGNAPVSSIPNTTGALVPSAASSSTSTNTASTSGTSQNFLTEQSISGIPNWALFAAAAVALFMFAGGKR